MLKRPSILIESSGEYGWVGNSRCPRQPEHGDTKNMFCPNREICILPQIFAFADKQDEVRKTMSETILPECLDNKRFKFLNQVPQFCSYIPDPIEADFVIKP